MDSKTVSIAIVDREAPMTNRYWQLFLILSLSLTLPGKWAISSPLAEPIVDPLIPQPEVERPLSPLEILRIEEGIDQLRQEGMVLWEQEQPELAFEKWYRQLRLQQILPDRRAEIEDLGNIGAIAWESNRVEDARNIQARLESIAAAELPENEDLLVPIAFAYEQLRSPKQAIVLYRKQLRIIDKPFKPDLLRTIARLSIDWLDYEEAAIAYERIQRLDGLTIEDQETLAWLYDELRQPEKAVKVKRELTPFYLQDQQLEQLIVTYLGIADDYRQLQEYREAVEFAEAAFTLAWGSLYLEFAEDSLELLAQIYLDREKLDFATQVYTQLLIAQRQSYNRFGMMETYAKLAQLYERQNNFSDALLAWQQGLAIAKELNHNISLFTEAIEALPTP